MDKSLLLTELLCGRLCYEIGALVAVLDASPAAAAGGSSDLSRQLTRRIALLREAWNHTASTLSVRRLKDLSKGVPGIQRLRLDFAGIQRGTAFEPAMGRMLLNALLLAAESLPRGGAISLASEHSQQAVVSIAGTHAGWPKGFEALLANPQSAWDAFSSTRNVVPPFVVLLSVRLGIQLSLLPARGQAANGRRPPALLLSPAQVP